MKGEHNYRSQTLLGRADKGTFSCLFGWVFLNYHGKALLKVLLLQETNKLKQTKILTKVRY